MSPHGRTFGIGVFARRIVNWRVSNSMRTDFVLDALEQALYVRQPERNEVLVHHNDRGSRYISIRYGESLADAGIEPSWGATRTATTIPWPRPLMVCTRQNGSIAVLLGGRESR